LLFYRVFSLVRQRYHYTLLLEVSLALTFLKHHDILNMFQVEQTRETKDLGTRLMSLALVLPKGELMKPMKKPVRLLGMVFQIDK
jgi:hypothetical protein